MSQLANCERPTIEERFARWIEDNGHVLDEMLRLARERLDQGETFISAKALWEEMRTSLDTQNEGGYRLNNDFTAIAARRLLELEPRLNGVIRIRQRHAA